MMISYRSCEGRLQGGVESKRLESCIYKSFIGSGSFSCFVLKSAIRINSGDFKRKNRIFKRVERFLESDNFCFGAVEVDSPIKPKDTFAKAEMVLRGFDRGFLEKVPIPLSFMRKIYGFFSVI
jgi:hypothetical protein